MPPGREYARHLPHESHRKPRDGGQCPSMLQEGWDIVDARHLAPTAGCGERGIAAASRHVEHLLPGTQINGLTSNSPTMTVPHAIIAQSPNAQVCCWRSLMATKSGKNLPCGT